MTIMPVDQVYLLECANLRGVYKSGLYHRAQGCRDQFLGYFQIIFLRNDTQSKDV